MGAFTLIEASATVSHWMVLRCSPARTLALAAALADRGAWTPTWKRRRRVARTSFYRPTTEPCMPTFVFVPAAFAGDLPEIPRLPYGRMRKVCGALAIIPDAQLASLRKIADKPLIPASRLPKPGAVVRFISGPFEGLRGKVVSCTIRSASVAVEGFAQPIQMPPSILQEMGA